MQKKPTDSRLLAALNLDQKVDPRKNWEKDTSAEIRKGLRISSEEPDVMPVESIHSAAYHVYNQGTGHPEYSKK